MTEKLLFLLWQKANDRGQVMTRAVWLQDELKCSFQELEAALALLAKAGGVEVLSPLPWLIAKLRRDHGTVAHDGPSWSGSSPDRVHSEQQISSQTPSVHIEVPVSSAAAAATQQREVGGAGEGEVLLDAVLRALGPDADPDEFRSILAGQPPALIYRCLKRVQATKNIRVSRAALFRSLLAKLSH